MADKIKIDWCDMSWNPVTGCLHDCPYCYARRVATRFGAHLAPLSGKQTAVLDEPDYFMQGAQEVRRSPFHFDFLPTFHRYRLGGPGRKTRPRNIFVKTFLSIEPLLEPFGESEYSARMVDWAIIGAETGNRREKVTPQREWVVDLVQSFQLADVPVFMKRNLADVWGVPLLQEYPEGLRHD